MSFNLPDDVIEAYAFANTPAYLYRKLHANEFVVELSNRTDDELIVLFESSNLVTLEEVALAYAVLMALLRKNFELSNLSGVQKMEWAPAFISLYRQKFTSMSITEFKCPSITSTALELSN